MNAVIRFAAAAMALALTSCGGGGGGGASGGSVTPVTQGLVAQPSTLALIGIGASYEKAIGLTDGAAQPPFTTSGCTNIITTTPANFAVTVLPISVGTCTLTIFDSKGNSAAVSISVATTAITGSMK